MKNLLKNQKSPVIVCIIAIVVLCGLLVFLIASHSSAEANLGKQQQWTSGKDSFDRAYEIAASDKETPDKTLYIPNLVDQLGKTVDEAVANIGQGATVISSIPTETVINLNNESGNDKAGTPSIVVTTNRSRTITKIQFSCNTTLLGYGNYSFVDYVDNLHVIEKSLTEAGLKVDEGSVKAPDNRTTYTSYDSDGTTVVMESCNFSDTQWQKGRSYKWTSNLNFNYAIANAKGDLSETVRTLTISIE